MLFGTCTDEELLAIAFPFVSGYNTEIVENHMVYKISEVGKVYAVLQRDRMVVDNQKPVARLLVGLYTDTEK